MTISRLTAFALGLLLPAMALAQPAAAAPAAPAAPPIAAPAAIKPPSTAPAAIRPPRFELLDRGDAVEIVAHNIKAARTAILPIRSRLQVPLAGAPSARRVLPTDSTVKLIELDGADSTRMLSVKLGFDPSEVKTLSRFAQAIQVGDDLHVLVPRKVPSDGASPRIPEPTLPPEIAAHVAGMAPPSEPVIGPTLEPARTPDGNSKTIAATEVPGKPAPDKLDARPDARSDAKLDARPDARPDARLDAREARLDGTAATTGAGGDAARSDASKPTPRPASDGKPLSQALASDADDTWSTISLYAALGVAAVGIGLWLLRRRRGNLAPHATIEIIAQRSLGGKARIVWLSAGPREMIVAVTPQQVRMLGQWRKSDATTALPGAYTHSDARPGTRGEPLDERAPVGDGLPRTERPLSPAVTGILRLRGRTGQMPAVSEEVATSDVVADELWAKEILAATGARR